MKGDLLKLEDDGQCSAELPIPKASNGPEPNLCYYSLCVSQLKGLKLVFNITQVSTFYSLRLQIRLVTLIKLQFFVSVW